MNPNGENVNGRNQECEAQGHDAVPRIRWRFFLCFLGRAFRTRRVFAEYPRASSSCLGVSVTLAGLLAALPGHAGAKVFAWGAGTFVTSDPSDFYNYGQSIVPDSLTNIVMVAGGWRHSLALRADGTVSGWGDGSLRQTNVLSNSKYISIACGGLHSLGLKSDGRVVAWGDDGYGQTSVPTNLNNVVQVAAGFYHSLALEADGTVAAWGTSTNINEIGIDPSYGQALVPTGLTNVVAIAAGGWHNLALRSDGTLKAWGRDDNHESDVPVGLSNVVAVAAGTAYSMALRSNGTLVVWGQDTFGQTNVPSGLSNVVAIAAGGWHALALKSDGTVVAWGAGTADANTNLVYGQNIVPSGLTNVIQIAAGWAHSLVLIGDAPLAWSASLAQPAIGTNGFTVTVPTHNGRVYALEYASSLPNKNWIAFPLRPGTGGAMTLRDPDTAAAQRFYRVRQW